MKAHVCAVVSNPPTIRLDTSACSWSPCMGLPAYHAKPRCSVYFGGAFCTALQSLHRHFKDEMFSSIWQEMCCHSLGLQECASWAVTTWQSYLSLLCLEGLVRTCSRVSHSLYASPHAVIILTAGASGQHVLDPAIPDRVQPAEVALTHSRRRQPWHHLQG